MGVHGLWDLLAPVGRRVSVETLAGKRLAIDASIWMVQFMKAMRDEKGEMVRNAHLLGFFRRICKLLFLRTKPVFVFDGATPALKRRTLAARRRHRDAARAKIRKTAEKLLISHLKARKLEELAAELKKSSQRKEDAKGKNVDVSTSTVDHQKLDELLAASLAAEEEADATGGASTSVAFDEEMEDDEDEEMILPVTGDNIDPAVLASLPPSMQLDLLVQMRERMMAENRQKYQKIKKSPAKFSELQIQSYLKTVAFRREINEVQRCASGRGLGGVQTSKIASETNREFIFSSSFTGDKQLLAQQVGSNGNADSNIAKKYTPSDSILNAATTSRSATKAPINELETNLSSEIETYKDERGRVRVSRLRGLGIRMTRDIQRNLDFIKEYEQESNMGEDSGAISPSVEPNDLAADISIPRNQVIEISFLEDPEEGRDSVDDIFLHLAAGVSSNKAVVSDDTEDIWEDGSVDENGTVGKEGDGKKQNNVVWTEHSSEGDDVDWEDGGSKMHATISNSHSEQAKISKGVLEEETLVQEAIRRSLEENVVSRSELPMASKGVGEEETLLQEAIRRSLEESVVRETRVSTYDNKTGNTILEEKESDEEEVDWEEGSCHSPINNASTAPNEQDTLMQEAISKSSEDMGREKSSNDMPGSTDAVKPGKNSCPLVFDTDLSPVECRGNGEESPPQEEDTLMQEAITRSFEDLGRKNSSTEIPVSTYAINSGQNSSSLVFGSDTSPVESRGKGEQSPNEDNVVKSTCNVSDVSVKCKLSQTNVKNLQGGTVDSQSDKVNPEFVEQQQADAISNIKGPIAFSDLGSISERKVHELDRSDSNQFDTSSISERGVHEFHNISDSNQSFFGISDDNNVAKESIGINLVSDRSVGGDADTADEDLTGDLNTISEANLQEEISLLRQEQAELGHQRRKLESHAEAVSSEMFAECQELLQMFGLPYIIAPTEAEAQCAFMEMNNLVDGVVTDDSDVFLFGARSVYKNIFDDRKYVETYFMKDIESELGLNREMLIRMAMLLGSDYTEGVSGIGIVNATEVAHAFPEEDGLKKFREWVESPDPSILENFDLGLKKKSLKGYKEGKLPTTDSEDVKEKFMDKHRNISKNWHLPASFPSQVVVDAYYSPQVDNSKETFSWGKPDLNLLRKLCWERLGWHKQKADELLLPVLKEYSKHETQLRLEAFYTFNERFAKIRSQRIKKAIKGISGGAFVESDDPVQEKNDSGEPSRGRRTRKKVNSISQKGRGRKRKIAKVPQEKSDSDGSGEECTDKDVPQDGASQKMTELRRSKRQRNQAKYTEDDIEAVDPDDDATNQSEATDVDEIAVDENPSHTDIDHTETVQVEDTERVVNTTEAAPKEYFFSGGGFCTEEGDENVDPDTDEPIEQVNSTGAAPKEYLFSGGGFCTGKGDDNVDPDTNEPIEQANEAQDVPKSPSTDTNNDVINTSTEQSASVEANPDFPIGGRIKWGLTAMPSLKRKKS